MGDLDKTAKRSFCVFVFVVLLMAIESWAGASFGWRLEKAEWTFLDEQNYQKYVSYIGEAVASGQCSTVPSCFRNPKVNPYASSSNLSAFRLFSDCADFPYFLRAYYAWMNQLPFGFITGLRTIESRGEGSQDIRYSPYGNVVTQRYNVIPQKSGWQVLYPNALTIFNKMLPSEITSGNFRVSYVGMDSDPLYSDFYPVRITREGVRPGAIIYDPNGHVVTVYKVTKDGRVYYLDAHPDNSLTTGLFNSRFIRSYPGQGAGFKLWRPLRLVGATYSGQEGYYGGRLVGARDGELPLYGTEQYYGTNRNPNWTQAEFQFNGRTMSYYDWIRNRLADGPLIENPVDDVKVMTQELCQGFQERATAVQVAVSAAVYKKSHPLRLPNNIYGAAGEWETYATPARDARLKVAFLELREYVESSLRHYRNHDGGIDYHGENLAKDLLRVYKSQAESCAIRYKNSAGQVVTLNLEQARARIYDLSFDPYHCPELRWGSSGRELGSCQDDGVKREWYLREKWMRYQHERDTEAFTGFALEELTGPRPGAGVATGQDLDIIAFLSKY